MTIVLNGDTGLIVSGNTNTLAGVTVGLGAGVVATNTAVGASALAANTTGSLIVAVGTNALAANTTGAGGTALGREALKSNTTGDWNIGIGVNALTTNTTGANNVAIGQNALQANTTASNNTAVGYQAGYSQTVGLNNTFIGTTAGYSSTTDNCTYVGRRAGYSATGTLNTFVGAVNCGDAVTTGARNTIIGGYSGNQGGLDIRTASNHIVLSDGDGNPRAVVNSSGNLGLGDVAAGNNRLYVKAPLVGAFTTVLDHPHSAPYGLQIYYTTATPNTADNEFIFARDSTNVKFIVYSTGNVVNRNNSYGGISDAKLKENIVDASPKLADLMQVKVRNYNLIGNPAKQLGVIAQELETVFPAMIDESFDKDDEGNKLDTTTKSVKYSVFVPMLLKAIQEQQALIVQLQADVAALKAAA
jgi:hypothetical protein